MRGAFTILELEIDLRFVGVDGLHPLGVARQKEIGIRKVIGASASRVALLLSSEFIKLVVIAMLVAFPMVWWVMNNWLNDFAYRVAIRADIFLITAMSALLITIITIGFQAVKAAIANPVKSLRTE